LSALALTLSSPSCDTATIVPEVETGGPKLGPAEVCFDPDPAFVRLRWEPRFMALAPGQKRRARLVVDPDFCTPTAVRFESTNHQVIVPPSEDFIDYGKPTVELELEGGILGVSELTAVVVTETDEFRAPLTVDVIEPTTPSCASSDGTDLAELAPGESIHGVDGLEDASISLPARADEAASPSVVWTVGAFDTQIQCAKNITPAGHVAMSPAVTFGPSDRVFPRDLPLSLPVNPVLLPEPARWRHLRVAYTGPKFSTPRAIPVTDPRVERIADGRFVLNFKANRLGTYQVVVKNDAGAKKRARRITHRAIVGVSMGGIGAAQFGLRHHRLFDVVAPLGGPVDWTWMLGHMEQNQLGGFRTIAPGTQLAQIQLEKTTCTTDAECQPDETCLGVTAQASGRCTLLPATDEPYEHAATFNNWWYEPNDTGNGGDFARQDYIMMFRDISLMYGNPVGFNPLAVNLPAGVDPEHPSQTGNQPDGVCKIITKPYLEDGEPGKQEQDDIWNTCPAARCQHVQRFTGYYDDEYNPDGTFPVITFCDGSPQDAALSPYASTWSPTGNDWPVEVGLAVDYNDNGVRDELEPIIKSGHETWRDWGTDATPSLIEPGYGSDNLDPSGDDYDARYNPTGTETDQRYQEDEPFFDDGLDGVPATASSPYDFGEADGAFTAAPGWQRFWDYCPRAMARGWSNLVDTPLDDEALSRVDLWTDGGLRDLVNFHLPAMHLVGAFEARGRPSATFSQFHTMIGLDPAATDQFNPAHVIWDDMQDVVMMRYGVEEPTAEDIELGSGMHVGTVNEITMRLQTALYFAASRWPDAPRTQVEAAVENPAEGVDECEIGGSCEFEFTSSFGRKGPVAVTLPPGYAHAELQHERYPVIYVLHGYGMTPEDLQAAIVFLRNWMNGTTDSQASRLAKAIIVYVDGRCRWQGSDKETRAECIRGSFYADSVRPGGPQMDAWFLELVDHIDQKYRTMGESVIEWPE
jgi:hypothetical protein